MSGFSRWMLASILMALQYGCGKAERSESVVPDTSEASEQSPLNEFGKPGGINPVKQTPTGGAGDRDSVPMETVAPGDEPATATEAVPGEESPVMAEAPFSSRQTDSSVESVERIRRDGATKEHRGYTPERVYFATNRMPASVAEAARNPDLYFGDERGELSWGTCEVSIPYKRRPGSLPEPSVLKLEFTQDPAKHVVLMEIERLPDAIFWKELRARVESSRDKQLMLFIHGYSATFRDAARRTAQMSYDLNYQGAAMFFSWPAGSESERFEQRANYLKDLRRAQDSDEDLVTVIQKVGRLSGARRIHLIAHSMGNFVLTEALKTIDDRLGARRARPLLFDQVVLAAPDLDARDYVKKNGTGTRVKPFAKRYTVYASTEDKALWLSKSVNGYEPLGYLNSHSQGGARDALYDLIDASQLSDGWFDSGHIYYGDMPEVLNDLNFILRGVQVTSLQRGLAETPPMFRLLKKNR